MPIAAENPPDYNKKIGGFALRKWGICGEWKNTFSFRFQGLEVDNFFVMLSYVAKIGRKTTSTSISVSASADDHSRPADRGRYGGGCEVYFKSST